MSALAIYNEQAELQFDTTDPAQIAERMQQVGIRFEQWQPNQPVKAGDTQEAIITAYQADIDRLIAESGF